MNNIRKLAVIAASFAALAACAKSAPPAADSAADETAARAVNIAWFKAYNAGDGGGVAALYAEDAVLNAPGAPAARGMASIREYFLKGVAAAAAAGVALVDGPTSDVGVSGDLAWQSGTFKITDKSGAALDAGKYISFAAILLKKGRLIKARQRATKKASKASRTASSRPIPSLRPTF